MQFKAKVKVRIETWRGVSCHLFRRGCVCIESKWTRSWKRLDYKMANKDGEVVDYWDEVRREVSVDPPGVGV